MAFWKNLFGWLVEEFGWLVEKEHNDAFVKQSLTKPQQQYQFTKVVIKPQRPTKKKQKKSPEPYEDVFACIGECLVGHSLHHRISIGRLAKFYNLYCGKYGLRKRTPHDLSSLLSRHENAFKEFGFDREFANDKIAYYFPIPQHGSDRSRS